MRFRSSDPSAKAGRVWLAATCAAGWGGLFATISLTALIGAAIDLLRGGQGGSLRGILLAGGAIVLGRAVLTACQRMAAFQAAADCKCELRRAIYRKLLDLGPDYVKSERTGALVNEAVEGVEALDAYYGLFLPQILVGFSAPLVICGYVMTLDWATGLILLVSAPLPPLLLGAVKRRFRSVTKRYHSAMGRLSGLFLDSVHGLSTLKLFGRAEAQAARIRDESEALRRETMGLLLVNQLVIFFMDWGFAISAVTVATLAGAWRWQAGALTVGGAFVAVLLSVEMVRQINLVAAFFFAGAGGRAILRKIGALLALEPAVVESPHARPPARWEPSIEFRDVSFRYAPEGPSVLDGVSFRVEPGEMVGIVGPSGGGKSTLLHLLMRFADPAEGAVLVSGTPLTELPLAWLRSRIALVAQDPHLFHGTIADNLRIARPDAARIEIEAAARDAHLHDFIMSLPRGYDTPIGERAGRLSGGQAQRLAIARAFLQDAPILLLDEATANLDARGEAAVSAALERLREGRTVLIVAHRAGALAGADRLLHLRGGRLEAAAGPPPFLVA